MSVIYDKRTDVLEVACDSCDRKPEEYQGRGGFLEAITAMKADGWSIRWEPDDTYVHFCPACREVPF